MSKTTPRRLLAQSSLTLFPDLAPARRLPAQCLRPFSQSSRRRTEGDGITTPPPTSQAIRPFPRSNPVDRFNYPQISPSLHPKAASGGMSDLASTFSNMIDKNSQARVARTRSLLDMDNISSDGNLLRSPNEKVEEPHRFHIYATRHNTHITVFGPPGCVKIKPDKEKIHKGGPLISVSSGNIGFKKSGRKHYDSAFQLASYVMSRMQEAGVSADIKRMEVVLRGFGAGREAVTKALLGTEGRFLRGKVVKVADATRLKFGGTRSKKPRRLG